tara:strand:- start:8105 stop:8638 length:534 start_codon:yes stop_codon:yes gene_type:complete
MYNDSNIGIRPIEEGDLEVLRHLRNDMSTFLKLGNVGMSDKTDQYEWWKNTLLNKKEERYTIVDIKLDKIIGIGKILNIDSVNSNCEIGVDIIRSERRKGYGYLSYSIILDYLFMQKNMHTISLKVIDSNYEAISLYNKLGFEKTGFFKEYIFRDGKYSDYNIMCLTQKKYFILKNS